MTYEEIVKAVKKAMTKKLASSVKEHLAVEIDIYGEGEGAFYVAIDEGVPSVEPYEYYDRDVKVYTTGDELVKILKGEKKATDSIEEGLVTLEGDTDKADVFFALFEKKAPAKKPAAKKAPAKKAAPKKAEAKAPAKAETKTPAKAETKTPAKAETKTPAKAEAKAPAKAETKAPAKAETKAPAKAETKAPAKAETKAPAKAPAKKTTKK